MSTPAQPGHDPDNAEIHTCQGHEWSREIVPTENYSLLFFLIHFIQTYLPWLQYFHEHCTNVNTDTYLPEHLQMNLTLIAQNLTAFWS